jgi:lipoate-protein ligase A
VKITDFKGSPKAFQDLRDKLIEATEDELVICQFTSAAVFIGKNADEQKVTHSTKTPLIRTGSSHGSSAYHDKNEFRVLGVITKASDFPFLRRPWTKGPTIALGRRVLADIMKAALNAVGVKVACRGDNILVHDKKVGHFGALLYDKVMMLSGHILLDWDIDAAEKTLISPKHNMREHVRGLKELGYNITFEQMRETFITAWEAVFTLGVLAAPPTPKPSVATERR